MKLINSKTEQDIREQLIKSHKSLFEDEEERKLLTVIKEKFPDMLTAYILHWIPEQGEDFYKILINDSVIVDIELDKVNQNIISIMSSIPVPKYKLGLSRLNQIKLIIAIDLAQKDLNKET